MQQILEKLKNKEDLSFEESKSAFELLMTGKAKEEEIYYFFKLINKLVKGHNLENTGYRLITNAGRDANQEVPHLHFHLFGGEKICKMGS